MAVSRDALGTNFSGTTSPLASSTSINVTAGASALVVSLVADDASCSFSGVTWGGTPLTLIKSISSADTTAKIEVWGLVNPASGTQSLSVSFTLGTATGVTACAISYAGTSTTFASCFPSGDIVSQNTGIASTSNTVTVTAPVGDYAYALGCGENASTYTLNQTAIYNDHTFLGSAISAANDATGAGTVTFTGTLTGASTANLIVGIHIVAAAGGAVTVTLGGSAEFYAPGLGPEFRFKPQLAFPGKFTAFNQTLTITATSTLTSSRSAGKITPIASTSTTSASRSVSKLLSLVATSTLAKVSAVAKALSISSTSSTVAVASRAFLRTLTIACTSSLTASRSVGKQVLLTATSTTSALKSAAKSLAITATSTLAAIRSVGKRLSITATTTLTAVASRAILKTVVIACTSAVTSTRAVGKSLALACTSTLTSIKAVAKNLAITATSSTVAQAVKARVLILTIACTTALSKSLSSGKVIAITATSALTSARGVGKVIAVACASTLSRAKAVSKSLTLTATSAVVGLASRAFILLLSITATTSTTARRSVGKVISVVATSSLGLARGVGKSIAIAATSAVTAIPGRVYRLILAIASVTATAARKTVGKTLSISAITSVAKSLLLTITDRTGRYARRIIGRPDIPVSITGAPLAPPVIARATTITIIGTSSMTIHDPIDFVCGTSWELTGPLQDANGNPLNLTGASISWKLDSLDGATNLASLSLGSGVTVMNTTTVTILVVLPPAQNQSIPAGSYRDWLKVTLLDGTVLPEWTGIIRVASAPA